jgi:hypothetical protein
VIEGLAVVVLPSNEDRFSSRLPPRRRFTTRGASECIQSPILRAVSASMEPVWGMAFVYRLRRPFAVLPQGGGKAAYRHVTAAVGDAIARGAIGFDAVKHLLLCRIERRPPRLDLTNYPYLPRATVAT